MKKRINILSFLPVGLIFLILIGIIIRTTALFFAFDTDIGYFDQSSPLTYVNNALVLVALSFGCVLSLLLKKDELPMSLPSHDIWSSASSMTLGFVFGVSAVLLYIVKITVSASLLSHIIILLAAISAIYYIYEGIVALKVGASTLIKVIFSILSSICLFMIVVSENFDFYTTLNNPEKVLTMFVFVISPIFFIQASRFEADAPQPKLFILSSFATAFLGAYTAIPAIIANCAGILSDSKYLIYYLLALALSVYAFVRFLVYIKSSAKHPTEE